MKLLILLIFISINIFAQTWKDVGISSKSMINKFAKYNITPDDIVNWKQSGFSIYDVERWIEAGITNLHNANGWKQLNIYANSVGEYKKKGVLTPKHYKNLLQLLNSHSNVDSWINKGLINPQEIKKWLNLGLKPSSSSTLKEFLDLGYSADNVKHIMDVMDIKNLENNYLKILKVARDLKEGKTTLAIAGAWGKLHLSDDAIKQYESEKLDADEVKRWGNLFLKYGYNNYTPETPTKEHLTNFLERNYQEVISWYKVTNGDINKAELYLKNNIKWISDVQDIEKSNIDFKILVKWHKNGFLDNSPINEMFIQELTPWYKNNFTVSQAMEWKKNNIQDAQKALKFKKLNLRPSEAKAYPDWVVNNKNAVQLVQKIKTSCGKLKTYEDVINNTIADKQKDTCFAVYGNFIGKIDGYPAFDNMIFSLNRNGRNYRIPYVLMSKDSGFFSAKYPKSFDNLTRQDSIGAIVKIDEFINTQKKVYVKLYIYAHSKKF